MRPKRAVPVALFLDEARSLPQIIPRLIERGLRPHRGETSRPESHLSDVLGRSDAWARHAVLEAFEAQPGPEKCCWP